MSLIFSLLATTFAATGVQGELIFLPNPQHNHGSSIVETPGGDLLAVWFHGSGERKSDDVVLQGARRNADGWSVPFIMADTPNLPDCNPVLYIDKNEKLWLFWVTIQNNEWGGALLKCRTSTDYEGDGAPNWDWQDVIHTEPAQLEEQFTVLTERALKELDLIFEMMPNLKEEVKALEVAVKDKLTRRLGWMTRVHPIETAEGAMVLGLYSDVFNCSLAGITADGGKTWSFSEPIVDEDPKNLANIQPSFVQRKNGEIVAYMRDNGLPKFVRTSTSTDGGKTWGPVTATSIRDSGASVEAIALKSGRWLMINNNLTDGRHILSLHISEDEGHTWTTKRALEKTEKDKGSFSYPSMIQTKDGLIHASYSYKVEEVEGSSIKHSWFDEEWVMAGEGE